VPGSGLATLNRSVTITQKTRLATSICLHLGGLSYILPLTETSLPGDLAMDTSPPGLFWAVLALLSRGYRSTGPFVWADQVRLRGLPAAAKIANLPGCRGRCWVGCRVFRQETIAAEGQARQDRAGGIACANLMPPSAKNEDSPGMFAAESQRKNASKPD